MSFQERKLYWNFVRIQKLHIKEDMSIIPVWNHNRISKVDTYKVCEGSGGNKKSIIKWSEAEKTKKASCECFCLYIFSFPFLYFSFPCNRSLSCKKQFMCKNVQTTCLLRLSPACFWQIIHDKLLIKVQFLFLNEGAVSELHYRNNSDATSEVLLNLVLWFENFRNNSFFDMWNYHEYLCISIISKTGA